MPQVVADLLLLLATAIWGSTFPMVKETISSVRPFTFLAARFLTASSALLLYLMVRRLRCLRTSRQRQGKDTRTATGEHPGLRPGFLGGCVITGMVLLFAYCTQTFGMLTIPAGKAAFIVGMSVVIVPVVSAILLKTTPDTSTSTGVLLAAAGLGFMSLTLPFRIDTGDLLVFLSAVGYAAHILLVGVYSKDNDPVVFATIQVMVVGIGSLVAAMLFERPLVIPRQTWSAILYCGILASAVTMLIQATAQRYTSATLAALMFSGEPVFGSFFSWLILGETLTPRESVGAVLILAGILISKISSLKQQPSGEEQVAI
ncbi:MAG: DMT family transporter [Bacillota bacterium]|jgi:drug/metabolite transporter (DMT)-like permease|nr:DMT family transporter [Candidatus Fermentithermobacillaceae bacterium]